MSVAPSLSLLSRRFAPRYLAASSRRASQRLLSPLIIIILLLGFTSEASALERFSATLRGGVRVTGNALGLSGGDSRNAPGRAGSLATFMADAGTRDGDFPAGTTSDWADNASTAMLALPENARVVYAELTWGASWAGGGASVAEHLDDDVTLGTSAGDVVVSADPSTSVTLDSRAAAGFLVRYYVRSAEVTEAIQRSGSGQYTLRGVPGVQAANVDELNAGGWTLAVVYYDPQDAMRNVTIASIPTWVDESQTLDLGLSGFCAPSTGEVFGHLAIWAMEGDAHLSGDRISIDAPAGAVPISSDANPSGNFFGAQLVARSGGRDLSGQHGDRNHDAVRGVNVPGGRQGWDIAQATLTSSAGHLRNGQRSARFLVETEDDSLLVVGAAFEIEMQAPRIELAAEWRTGATLTTASITLHNLGAAAAEHITLVIDSDIAVESAIVDGVLTAVNRGDEVTSIALGDLAPEEQRTLNVTFDAPPLGEMPTYATFEWTPCEGERFAGELTNTLTLGPAPLGADPDAGTPSDGDAGSDPDSHSDSDDGSDVSISGADESEVDDDALTGSDGSSDELDTDSTDNAGDLSTDPTAVDADVLELEASDAFATPPDRRTAQEPEQKESGCTTAAPRAIS
ncbi:MAG: hypothetical protein ACI82G_002283, partial [Bradymonadia bacterium]